MRITRDSHFDTERERFALRHTCEECGHYDRVRAACSHEWPILGHRLKDYATPLGLPGARSDILFCKEFELC